MFHWAVVAAGWGGGPTGECPQVNKIFKMPATLISPSI